MVSFSSEKTVINRFMRRVNMKSERFILLMMICFIFVLYMLLASCLSNNQNVTKAQISLNELNLLKKPLNFSLVSYGNHVTVTDTTKMIEGILLYFLEANPPFKRKCRGDLLYLHGASYSSHTWNTHTPSILQMSAAAGYRTIAIDLPGFARSRSGGSEPEDRSEFMMSLMEELNITMPIIVSPSASGRYSIPYVLNNQDKLSGFVPIAPCCLRNTTWKNFTVPTLIVYGSREKGSVANQLLEIPHKNLLIIKDARHSPYIEKPIEFMTALVNFMDLIHPPGGFSLFG